MSDAETRRILAERDWWRALAERLGMRLAAWDGMPPGSGAVFYKDGQRVEVPGLLAEAVHRVLTQR